MKAKIKKCDCQDYENGFVSNYCPVHNDYPIVDYEKGNYIYNIYSKYIKKAQRLLFFTSVEK